MRPANALRGVDHGIEQIGPADIIADDSAVVADSISRLLNLQPDLEVVGLAKNGLDAVEKARELLPNVVIMDVEMPKMNGLEATKRIKEVLPDVGILFLSYSTDYDVIEASVAAGGDGYLTKPPEREKLLTSVRQIAARHKQLGD